MARPLLPQPLTIALTGSSGMIGSALAALLTTGGHRVIRLVRRAPRGQDERRWLPDDPDPELLSGTDVLIHLAGAPIGRRFTQAHKTQIRDSRVGPTRRLAELAARAAGGPSTVVTASAIGYYGADRDGETLTETSPRGSGFLADVVADWEAAADPAVQAGIRVVAVRTGIVQSPRGGVLRLLRHIFNAGLGGPIGTGAQWMSWIGIDDLVGIYHRVMIDTTISGPVNATAPAPVRNADYAATLARVLHRPAVLPAPALGPRLVLGEDGARELALANQRVVPQVLTRAQYEFRHPELEPVLRHLLGRHAA